MSFPAWLGIGAQRSGTTWLTDLLTQHPQVGLGTNGKKEQHLLHKVADGNEPASAYLDLFPDDGVRRGDWTPQYLRHSSMPGTVARLDGDAPIFVVLRDPVERFRSAMRLAATRGKSWPYPVPITVQTWTGCYADQQSKPKVWEELLELASECRSRSRAVFLACRQCRYHNVVASHATSVVYIIIASPSGETPAVSFI
jgi:hypothetical protein